jgi:hypothetical protein
MGPRRKRQARLRQASRRLQREDQFILDRDLAGDGRGWLRSLVTGKSIAFGLAGAEPQPD